MTIKISPVALADLRPNCLRPHKASMREDVVRAPVAVHAYQNVFLMHIMAKLQFMVWGTGAPGAPGLPDDELVMYSKSEMACFAKGKNSYFRFLC